MTSPEAVRAVIEQWRKEAVVIDAQANSNQQFSVRTMELLDVEASIRRQCADELEAALAAVSEPNKFPPVQLQDGASPEWTCPQCGKDLLFCDHPKLAVSEVPEQAKQPMTNDEAMKLTGRVLTVGGLPFTVISASTYGDVRVFDPSRNVHLVFDSRETFENWAHGTPVPAAAPPPAEESR
jgi:hypothetical protein